MATIDITTEDFEQTVTGNDIVFVDFWADWCAPCKRFGPIFEQVSEDYGDVVFAKVDTEASPQLMYDFQINAIPRLMAFREGVQVFDQPGAMPAGALRRVVDAIKGLDMAEIHAQVAELKAKHGATAESQTEPGADAASSAGDTAEPTPPAESTSAPDETTEPEPKTSSV